MIALLVVLAAVLLILGANESAKKVGRLALALIVLMTALPCVMPSFPRGMIRQGTEATLSLLLGLFALLLLALIGFILWQRRAAQQRAREADLRRNGQPRRRALPPPPRQEEPDSWSSAEEDSSR